MKIIKSRTRILTARSVPRRLLQAWSEFFYPRFARTRRIIYAISVGIPVASPLGCARLYLEIIGKYLSVAREHDQMIVLGCYFGLFDIHIVPAICHTNTALRCTIALEIQRINLWLASGRVFALPTSWASWIIITRRVDCEMRFINEEPPV